MRLIVFSLLISALVSGCEPATRYKVLNFFFMGVPPPEKEKKVEAKGKSAGPAPVERTSFRPHGPYAAGVCNSCHERGTNELVLPLEKLCFKCHDLNIRKTYIHGPVASGGCRVCHEPHGSAYGFLLSSDPKQFCLFCHERRAIERNEAHTGVEAECTECHNAHSSDQRYLLK